MSGVYVLTDTGAPPVTLDEARDHLRLHSDADDDLVQDLVHTATQAAEEYTRREFRANQWSLLLDEFEEPPGSGGRICIRRDPVASIDAITHLVSGSPVTVASSVYYLKRGVQSWEVLLNDDQEWPDDTDPREQAITVSFTTAPHRRVGSASTAIQRLVAHLYENRGDCDPVSSGGSPAADVVRRSGAGQILDQFRVSRV